MLGKRYSGEGKVSCKTLFHWLNLEATVKCHDDARALKPDIKREMPKGIVY